MHWPFVSLELVRDRQREVREEAERAHLAAALRRVQREARERKPGRLVRVARRFRGVLAGP
jgi:hypothetical protein